MNTISLNGLTEVTLPMRYGYMPSSGMDLLSEINFAKKYFDFIEITLKLDLSEYTEEYISKIKSTLSNFEVLGHIHWELNLLTGENSEDFKKICKSIEIFKELGAKKVTIHPSSNKEKDFELIKKKNLQALSKIANFCKRKNLQLLVENAASPPFNRATTLNSLIRKIPNLAITLDVGHANRTFRLELNKFLKLLGRKIKHIHLHDDFGGLDHIPFKSKKT